MRWLLATCLLACGSSPATTPDAIVAPPEQWTFVPIDGFTCGNGSPSGIGINLSDRSDRVMIYFEGGGACWDAATCFGLKSAINIEVDYGASSFATDIARFGQSYLGQRVAANPFRDATWVYVPYCTGDLHDGTRMATYDVVGTARTVHHVGGLNADRVFAHVAATRPSADTVWLVGISAGAYGVGFNVGGARTAWPSAAVHVLADSSPLVSIEPTRWGLMQQEWAMRFPPACTSCATNLGALPAALAAESPPGHRYGLLAFTRDQVIATYFGIGQDDLRTKTLAEQAAMSGDQAAFVLEGTEHVMLGNPAVQAGGVVLSAWIDAWATGAPTWANAGP